MFRIKNYYNFLPINLLPTFLVFPWDKSQVIGYNLPKNRLLHLLSIVSTNIFIRNSGWSTRQSYDLPLEVTPDQKRRFVIVLQVLCQSKLQYYISSNRHTYKYTSVKKDETITKEENKETLFLILQNDV